MYKALIAIPALLFFSACSHNYYSINSISKEINERSNINHVGEGLINSPHGAHQVLVEDVIYKVIKYDRISEEFHLVAEGMVIVDGAPYSSSPTFVADILAKAGHNEVGNFKLNIQKVSNMELKSISDLHLYGIRDKVKDIIAMTLVDKSEVILHDVLINEGGELNTWGF